MGARSMLLVIIITMLIAIPTFSWAVRRMLGTDTRKWFSYDHVNEHHRKMEWMVRFLFFGILIVSAVVTSATSSIDNRPWFLEVWWLLLLFIVVIDLLRAFMEYKYVESPRAHVATLAELCFNVILSCSAFMTGFYGVL
jgi:magnesium-transporting ATPase (P-type)